ncbi:MAG: alpha/beta hydrolase [Betaproteobacteria bacterium]|nr:alpha/beta hydrolase [Betaproteobacteria bacterium]
MVWSILGTLAAAYGALLVVVFLFQSRLVYFPEIGKEVVATPRDAGLEFEDVRLATSDGVSLHAWFVPARAPRGTVLLFHGNAGNISHRLEYLLMFQRLGYSSFIFDYRGYGLSGGSPGEEGTYRDAQAAWRYLIEVRKLEPRRIVLLGESLGGAVAAWLAVRERPGALVLASVFTSVPDMGADVYPFLPVRLLSRYSYNTRDYLASVQSPVLVAHSRDDDIVPYRHGQALFAAAREPKVFLEMRGGHNDGFLFMREEWVRQLGVFLERHVPGAAALTGEPKPR